MIKGADFFNNSVDHYPIYEEAWYSNYVELQKTRGNNDFKLFNATSKYWAFQDSVNSSMQGKPINAIRLIPFNYSSINLYKMKKLSEAIGSPVATATFNSGNSEIFVKLDKTIILGDNEYLVFDNGSYDETEEEYHDQDFYRKVGSSEYNLYDIGRTLILIDFGYQN